MSGIVALLRHDGAPTDVGLLTRMTECQRFRGPDGIGQWSEGPVGLGHTLHKATLEAEREVQPAAYAGKLFITADARIDAREDLCEALRGRGIDAQLDATDPELILAAYATWGEACVEHLLGDFSFALWDAQERKLFCAVDHLGVKPFFYANRDGLFAAANSLRCVRLHPSVRDELDEIAVGDFLMFGYYVDRDRSIYQHIHRIAPGHTLVVKHGELRLRRYFQVPTVVEARHDDEGQVVEQFRSLLTSAVRDRLRVPRAAVQMSGGLDSPLVALTARGVLPHAAALGGYCLVHSPVMKDDELRYAASAAGRLGMPLYVRDYSEARLFDVGDAIDASEPNPGPALGPWFRQIRDAASSFPAMLTGWDGDLLLYANVATHWRERIAQRRISRLAREVGWYVVARRGLPPVGLRNGIKAVWRSGLSDEAPAWLAPSLRARLRLDERWAQQREDIPSAASRGRSPHVLAAPNLSLILYQYDAGYLRCALESRHPLLDLRVIRFAFGLPAVPWCVDKELLRRCLGPLVGVLGRRPKTPLPMSRARALMRRGGLGIPEHAWQSPALRDYAMISELSRTLEQHPSDMQLMPALRGVSLGLWLAGRS